jgi:hypothetical protein
LKEAMKVRDDDIAFLRQLSEEYTMREWEFWMNEERRSGLMEGGKTIVARIATQPSVGSHP